MKPNKTAISLLEYQSDAARRINNFLDHNLGRLTYPRRLALLQGPTGMGKTYTIGKVIKDNSTRNVAFLWISPSQGSLPIQTHEALGNLGIDVKYGNSDSIASGDALNAQSVTVISWSLVDKESNKAIQDGERDNIFDLARTRSSENVEIVIIIDEAHHAAKKGKKAKAFLKKLANSLGYSPITIEVTATPTSLNQPDAAFPEREIKVVVDIDDVIESGMIAKGIRVNAGLEEFAEKLQKTDSAEVVLHAGLSALEEYSQLLAKDTEAKEWKNPLLLVQVPNGKEGKFYIEMIERICETYGITEGNGKLGRYLSDNSSDMDELKRIASFDSSIEVLIFKQGVALGWDCPRAKGLVAYRESANQIFRVQTVGRIVRMPEHRHYANDFLNRAFIYTNLENSLFDFSNSGTNTGYLSDKVLRLREDAALPKNMPTNNWSRAGFQGNVTAERLATVMAEPESVEALAKVADSLDAIQSKAVITESVLTDVDLSTEDVFNESSNTSGKTSQLTVSDASLKPLFRSELSGILPNEYTNVARSVDVVLSKYTEWFATNAPHFASDEAKARRQAIITFLASSDVRKAWEEVLKLCAAKEPKNMHRQPTNWEDYVFPLLLPASSEKGIPVASVVADLAATYLYVDEKEVAFLENKEGMSGAERSFMEEVLVGLKNEGRLIWWWKNGESGNSDTSPYFRICHMKYREGQNNRVYPDYIACYRDGEGHERYAALEVKHGGGGKMNAFNDDSRIKAETLGDWANNVTEGQFVAGVTYLEPSSGKWMFADTEAQSEDRPLFECLG